MIDEVDEINEINEINDLNVPNGPNGKRKAKGFNYLPPGPAWVLVRGGEVL